MRSTTGMIFFIILCFGFYTNSAPKGKQTKVTFDKALPEDISNENFPDRVNSFDFPNANLLDLVKAIVKLTGINFIVDPSLGSKQISIIAPSPITVAEAYKAFLSALSANGYTVIRSGAFWKIESTEKAHKDNIEVYSGDYFPNTDQLITRIIKLKHINAVDFEKSIRWLLSQQNKISTLENSNSIILSDYGSVIERIMKIVYELDVPGSEESIRLIQVEHASAEELASLLSELLSTGKRSSKRSSFVSKKRSRPRVTLSPNVKKEGSLSGKVKISNIIPDMRTNSLVVAANEKGFEKVQKLVKKLDAPVDPSRTGGVYVYNVLYGTAEEVYNTLMGIKPSGKGDSKSQNRPFPIRSGRIGRSSPRSSQSPLFGNVNIMADSNTNSLIISAKNKYEYERVLSVLKKIDVPRDQVFIQAIIVEMIVDKGDDRQFNLAGALLGAIKYDDKTIEEHISSNQRSGRQTPIWMSVLGSTVAGFLSEPIGLESLQKASFGPGLVLGLPFMEFLKAIGSSQQNTSVIYSADDIIKAIPGQSADDKARRANIMVEGTRNAFSNTQALNSAFIPLLKLLKTSTNVNVLSTPQVTTLDNVQAFIEVGENAPLGVSTTNVAGTFQSSPTRENVTIKLDITPRINPQSGTVQMDIKQKFDDFSERSSSYGVHVLKRNIETKMVLHDGETAVLGGLLTDKEIKNENKIPILGDLPLFGWLFKGSEVKKEKRNLLVFITPTIIKGKEQKRKAKEIVGKKLEERLQFIEDHMKGKDPHKETLEQLIPESKEASDRMLEMKKWKWKQRWNNLKRKHRKKRESSNGDSWDKDVNSDNLSESQTSENEIEEPTFDQENAEQEIEEDIELVEADVKEEIEGEESEELSPADFQQAVPLEDSPSEEVLEKPQDDFIPIEPEIIE